MTAPYSDAELDAALNAVKQLRYQVRPLGSTDTALARAALTAAADVRRQRDDDGLREALCRALNEIVDDDEAIDCTWAVLSVLDVEPGALPDDARPVRDWQTGREPIVAAVDPVWACSHCGPCLTSRPNWCDLGCGRDYNRMVEMQLWGVPNQPSAVGTQSSDTVTVNRDDLYALLAKVPGHVFDGSWAAAHRLRAALAATDKEGEL